MQTSKTMSRYQIFCFIFASLLGLTAFAFGALCIYREYVTEGIVICSFALLLTIAFYRMILEEKCKAVQKTLPLGAKGISIKDIVFEIDDEGINDGASLTLYKHGFMLEPINCDSISIEYDRVDLFFKIGASGIGLVYDAYIKEEDDKAEKMNLSILQLKPIQVTLLIESFKDANIWQTPDVAER